MRTEFEILKDIDRLYLELSPENISWDGMRSRSQVQAAARKIHQQLKKLFKELGREVDEYEVMQELRALRGKRSAKQTTRRSASEVISDLQGRIAKLERQMRVAGNYNPNDTFKIEKGNGYIRIYVGGKYNDKRMISKIEETFYKTFSEEFMDSNEIPRDYTVKECVEDAFDSSKMVEMMSRVAPGRGERAIQFNLYNTDKFLKNVVRELEDARGDFDNPDYGNSEWEDYFLEWSDEYEADSAIKKAVKALMDKYGKVDPYRINPNTYRLASTRKVAGHIVLAGTVNVRQLRRDLEDTFGIEDIEIEDGVLTFLMSTMDNNQIEKQVKSLAKKHKVKFEKGEFTDGLGMIYTKNASRRNRY